MAESGRPSESRVGHTRAWACLYEIHEGLKYADEAPDKKV